MYIGVYVCTHRMYIGAYAVSRAHYSTYRCPSEISNPPTTTGERDALDVKQERRLSHQADFDAVRSSFKIAELGSIVRKPEEGLNADEHVQTTGLIQTVLLKYK